MNSKRVYQIMLGLVGVLFIALLAGAYGVNNLMSSHSKKLVDFKLQNAVLTRQETDLAKAKAEIKANAGLEEIAESVVPQDKDQAEAVREIANIAVDSGIGQLSSVTFPASTLGNGVAKIGTTTVPTTSNANSITNKLTQLTPVVGITGVYQLQITIAQTADNLVPYDQFITFLSKLEQNRRTAQVTGLTLTPDTKNPDMVAFTLIVNEFIKP